MVLRLLITDRWLDPLATAHKAADGGTGLRALADGPVLSAAEALLWCVLLCTVKLRQSVQ